MRKTSNVILGVLGVFLLAFITAMTAIFCVKGAVPDTLIQYTLGAGGVEAMEEANKQHSDTHREIFRRVGVLETQTADEALEIAQEAGGLYPQIPAACRRYDPGVDRGDERERPPCGYFGRL